MMTAPCRRPMSGEVTQGYQRGDHRGRISIPSPGAVLLAVAGPATSADDPGLGDPDLDPTVLVRALRGDDGQRRHDAAEPLGRRGQEGLAPLTKATTDPR